MQGGYRISSYYDACSLRLSLQKVGRRSILLLERLTVTNCHDSLKLGLIQKKMNLVLE